MDNVVSPQAPQCVEIHPSQGDTILLHGWLRAYAEAEEATESFREGFGTRLRSHCVRLELYEATDGQWLYVETVNDGDVTLIGTRHCRVELFADKAACQPHFQVGRQYASALMKKAGLSHVRVIGRGAS